ncbi:MAG: long-chain-fatty-acid--CoA ligase [Ilumatobacteraceae bacterium]
MPSPASNIGHFVSKRALLNPDLEALVDVDTGRRFTFAELNERVNRTAHVLTDVGVGRGDRVGLLMMNSVEFEETFFAVAKLGAVVVPLNWRLVPDELTFILADAGVEVVVYGVDFVDAVAELRARGDETSVRTWIQVDGDVADGALDHVTLQAAADTTEIDVETDPDDLLYIMYTSGTTGLPKGVMHSHSTALWAVLTVDATADQHFGDRYLVALPLFHVGALTPAVAACYAGVTQIVMRTFDPVKVWQHIEAERVTTGLLVPAMLQFMLQTRAGVGAVDLSRVRWIMSGASPVPVTLIEAWAELGIEIHQVYGLTESCGPACLISPDEALSRAGSTGKEFFFTRVRVIDSNGDDAPPGTPGELICQGPHIMVGYWHRPEATAEAIVDGWLHTGDIAVLDKDGYVYISDRIKDMIISGGENVYPAEIENVLLSHPAIADVAVIGLASEQWGETPLAVVVRGDEAVTEAEILAYTEGKLARYKRPSAVTFVDEIPRNPSGKALKRILREQLTP